MTVEDLDGVVAVARIAFPDHPEGRACFVERLALAPGPCFVLARADRVAGYLIAYPW
ncbi:GNAT family N-acetyltransferase, partial [Escherichia coli]|nr:GNAT family N-acetyltransferase [Escherichia coli]